MRQFTEIPELEKRESIDDRTDNVAKFFSVSSATAAVFATLHWQRSVRPRSTVISIVDDRTIGITAFERDGYWYGWDQLRVEMRDAGLVPEHYGL